MNKKSHRNRTGIVYSTNPDFEYQENTSPPEEAALPPEKQDLRVIIDRKNRSGKTVTLVTGFRGTQDELESMGKMLKTRCGVGGTVKNGKILIQGDLGERILQILRETGYRAKKSGG